MQIQLQQSNALWNFQCLLMGEGQASELGLSTAGQVLLGKIPPTHFCSTVVRLLALQVRALGVSGFHSRKNVFVYQMYVKRLNGQHCLISQETYSLEQACGVQYSIATPHDKSDVLLMHLLIPMCLRVGTGRKGKHKPPTDAARNIFVLQKSEKYCTLII